MKINFRVNNNPMNLNNSTILLQQSQPQKQLEDLQQQKEELVRSFHSQLFSYTQEKKTDEDKFYKVCKCIFGQKQAGVLLQQYQQQKLKEDLDQKVKSQKNYKNYILTRHQEGSKQLLLESSVNKGPAPEQQQTDARKSPKVTFALKKELSSSQSQKQLNASRSDAHEAPGAGSAMQPRPSTTSNQATKKQFGGTAIKIRPIFEPKKYLVNYNYNTLYNQIPILQNRYQESTFYQEVAKNKN